MAADEIRKWRDHRTDLVIPSLYCPPLSILQDIKMKGEEDSTMVNENGQDHAPTNGIGDGKFIVKNNDAGAVFVLESKGCLPLHAHL